MSKTEQIWPEINRWLCFIKDKEREANNLLADAHHIGHSKNDKNAMYEDLQELYDQLEQAYKIVKDLINDCTDAETDCD